jgi:PrtD family type I secretion system ABC transporter
MGPVTMVATTSKPRVTLLAPWRRALAAAGLFSLFLNLLVLTLPLYSLQVFDRVLSSRSVETLVMLTIVAGGALVVLAGLDMVRARLLSRIGTGLDATFGIPVLRAGMTAPPDAGTRPTQGLRDLTELRTVLSGPAVAALFDAPWAPFFLALLFLLHPLLGTLALAGAALLFTVALLNERLTRSALQAAGAATGYALSRIETSLHHADAVRAMGLLPGVIRRWQQAHAVAVGHAATAADRSALIGATAKLIRFALQIGMMGAAAWLVINRETTPGAMIASSVLMGRALAPVEAAITGWRSLVSARAAHHRLIDSLSRAGDRERQGGPAMRLPAPKGRLTVDNLTFSPPGTHPGTPAGTERPTLRNVSFDLEPGEVLGVLGPSGAGKSTLARLLVGVTKPSSGKIRLDGADLNHWDPDDLGRHLGYLPQDVQLIGGAVRDDIARLDRDADPAEVVAAARKAGVHDLIQRLPQGYDTDIGDGGLRLSGGQRQRLGLARALYGRPCLLVLDEPNAHLDAASEESLLRAIGAAKAEGTTVVIIAHRPSMVSLADKLLLLRDGAVEMFGSRADILPRITRQAIHPAANLSAAQ